MKPFHTIAIPHRDILDGKLTMEVFAADLWETYAGRALLEYKDAATFFKKTYLTQGLKNLLSVVEKRLTGAGGDPVIQIQTPFGGGKTHALIAMFHRAKEWGAKTVVIVGTAMSPEDTIWGTIEKQLTGNISQLSGNVSPGREKLRTLLKQHQPVLILMDEVLEYTTKAAGVQVRDTSLASQTIAFMQELTEVAGTLDRVCLVVTLPSSILEHYDEKAERLFQQLQKVAGRVERIYTPVQEQEITKVIRRRLFSDVDETKAEKVVSEFMDYAERENILPLGKEPSEYRNDFIESYPFFPEVISVLYQRWGSFPTFQRTRGVLRLLSLVVHSLSHSGRPYITPADFELGNEEIRRELIKHIGNEFDSVIGADITGSASGSKKIDKTLGKSFLGLSLGSRSSTTIFLYSFSGGVEKGAHLGEVKRSATTTENPSSVIAEAVEQLKNNLFYLQSQNDKYFFSNQPNLNRILLTKMENIKDRDVVEAEEALLKQQIRGGKLKVFLWPRKPRDIPDNEELKLVITQDKDLAFMRSVLESKGDSPRVNRNTVFFLAPSEAEKGPFEDSLKKKMAYEQIEADKTLNLTSEQRTDIKNSLRRAQENLQDAVRRLYRVLYTPAKTGLKDSDMGIPTYGATKGIDQDVYDKLRNEQEILEKIAPLVIRERYLREPEYVRVVQIFDSMLKTPGERRAVGPEVLEAGIVQGVKQGLFGLGDLKDNNIPVCRYFKEDATVSATDVEVLIREDICLAQRKSQLSAPGVSGVGPFPPGTGRIQLSSEEPGSDAVVEGKNELSLRFRVPRGKVSQIMGMMNFLQSKFQSLDVELTAREGSLSEEEYASKIKEALRQLGVSLEEKS
jgi:hypothetical protein